MKLVMSAGCDCKNNILPYKGSPRTSMLLLLRGLELAIVSKFVDNRRAQLNSTSRTSLLVRRSHEYYKTVSVQWDSRTALLVSATRN